jgi:hypothetical protein
MKRSVLPFLAILLCSVSTLHADLSFHPPSDSNDPPRPLTRRSDLTPYVTPAPEIPQAAPAPEADPEAETPSPIPMVTAGLAATAGAIFLGLWIANHARFSDPQPEFAVIPQSH